MRSALSALLALAALLPHAASAAPPPRPKLIVAIAIDQFSADLFAEYRAIFSGGLKRLAEGVVFPSGYQSHAATETCPGHSTILTGARPERSGIIANSWFDLSLQRADKKVYCAEDPTAPGSDSDHYVVSSGHLKVPTLGDRLKAANPATRVVAVAGKDRSAVMMGGHATDELWFWKGDRFVTLADRTAPPPAAIAAVNRRVAALIARPGSAKAPPLCRSRAVPVPVGDGKSVGAPVARAAGDAKAFRAGAGLDDATADLAIALLRDLKLGRGPAPDLLAIGLSATDYVGHGFGTEGAEMCAQMLAVDATVGHILAALDASGVPYAVVLTADHGGHDLPERNARRAMPAAERVDAALSPAAIGKALATEYGLTGDPIYADAPFGDWYLARDIAADLRPRLLASLRAKLTAHRQVEAVFTAEELRRLPSPRPPVDEWSLAERARANFDPGRSGELIVFLKQQVTPIANRAKGSVATHGSPWDYDRRVPILFAWPGVVGFEQPLSIETVDIMPTLAGLLDLPVPAEEIDGRCLDLDAGEGDSCG